MRASRLRPSAAAAFSIRTTTRAWSVFVLARRTPRTARTFSCNTDAATSTDPVAGSACGELFGDVMNMERRGERTRGTAVCEEPGYLRLECLAERSVNDVFSASRTMVQPRDWE